MTRYRPWSGETICPADGSSIKKSRRIYVRPRTGPQSAHLWWPAVAKLQPASVPMPRQLRRGTDRRTDRAIPKWPLRRGIITVGYRTVAAVELTRNFCASYILCSAAGPTLSYQRPLYENVSQSTRSTQPCIPPGSLNRIPASAGIKAGLSPLSGGG